MRFDGREDKDQTIDAARVVGVGGIPVSPRFIPADQGRLNRFAPGQLLSDRFLIIRFLGAGGMGEVYEAEDRLLKGASIALKAISPDVEATADILQRFEREVLLARQINHPNVCPIYDIHYHQDEQGTVCFLCMKLLPGETLAARLDRESRLLVSEAVPVIRQIAAALYAAHREAIIHRDIKPSNIMLQGSGPGIKAVVMDFGLARKYDSSITVPGFAQVIGTPSYMAPEVLQGEPSTAASDLYAFALVMNEIFGGKRPSGYNGQSVRKLTPALRSSDVPPFLASLITHCLSDDPGTRCRAFKHAMARLNLDTRAAETTYHVPPVLSRRQLWTGAAAASACVVAGGGAWKWQDIARAFNPLPRKRFVALVNFPPTSDRNLSPVLSGLIDSLERELSRAEAFDHDLFVMAGPDITRGVGQLDQVRNSLGANLVLALSSVTKPNQLELTLKILSSSAGQILRHQMVTCALDELAVLPVKAVHAAAELLDVAKYLQENDRLRPGTQSAEAYQAVQQAEAMKHQPNDAGLEPSIEKYKAAVELDSRYAIAHARLALAYIRLYALHRNPAALDLAQANANTALDLDNSQVEAHRALGWIYENRNQRQAGLAEMDKALALDPSDTRTIVWQAQYYGRLNEFARAEKMFHLALKTRPNNWLAYNELGEVLNRQGKYSEAMQAYRAASLSQPQNALPMTNMGNLYFKQGQLTQAKQYLEKSLALSPSALAAADLAQARRAEGKYSEALTYAQKAVDLDPTDDESWLELGECHASLPGHARQTLDAYSRASDEAEHQLQIDDSDGPRSMLLALYQAKLGKAAAAKITARKAEQLGAIELDSQLFKARVLELVKERDAALTTLAVCVRRGASEFELSTIADLKSLRADPRYLTLFDRPAKELL